MIPKLPKRLLPKLYIEYVHRWFLIRGTASVFFNSIIYGKALSIGEGYKVWGRFVVKIVGNGFISIGKNAHFVSDEERSYITLFSRIQLTAYGLGRIEIGDNVALNGTVITSKKWVSIGSGTMIAPNVIIVDSDFHQTWPPESRFISDTSPFDEEVKIGKNVWIGMNSLILKGSVIGDNSIIAAGSIVTGEIPPNCMAAGSPAKPIKFLNE
jgi:acetyltransferase-like isoleucine patch superfamily enzyme